MRRLLVVVLILTGAVLHAQGPDQPSRLASMVRNGQLRLSLDEAIALALEQNLDVQLQRLGPALADTDVTRTLSGALARGVPVSVREGPKSIGAAGSDALAPVVGTGSETNLSIGSPSIGGPLPPSLDAVLVGRMARTHSAAPQVNSFQVGTTSLVGDTSGWNVALQKGFLTGGSLAVSFENSRQALNHPRYDLNPFQTSSLGVTFTQPLLRGFGPALNSRFIRIARNSRHQSDLVFQQQLISTTAAVIRLYWDLVSLTEEIGVRRQAVERAERLLRDNQEHADVGTRAPIEVVRARAEVARAERDLIVAQGQRRQQETILVDYLSLQTVSDPALAGVTIVPTDVLPLESREPIPPTAELADRALKDRPDIAQARVQIESSRAALTGSRNARLPSLDLVASARTNGLAGDLNAVTVPGAGPHTTDPALIGSYGTALSQLYRRDFPDYGVALQVAIPLQNRAADADVARDRVTVRQQELRLRQLEKQVYVEIENARIVLEQAGASVQAVVLERELQEQALAAEEEKLAVGASTSFVVIQYQRDLAQARSAEIAARAAYVKAMTALHRASGTLLDDYGITVVGTDIQHREGDLR
jgi:outer membrane protein TolC